MVAIISSWAMVNDGLKWLIMANNANKRRSIMVSSGESRLMMLHDGSQGFFLQLSALGYNDCHLSVPP